MAHFFWKLAREVLVFCTLGALCGAAIGFIMFLHLGPFKSPADAGYAAGLFVKSGVQLGFAVFVIRALILGLRRQLSIHYQNRSENVSELGHRASGGK